MNSADMPTAPRILLEARPDTVIIEQMLFGWEAFPIVGELRRAAGHALPVVMTTGWADEEVVARARAAGVDEFLVHPFFEQLIDAVGRVCPFRVSQTDGSQ
jgi:DNA-binding response OmpR family regulator